MTGFRCKEFYVGHDRCGMKVNTDSIVLGAWAELTGVNSVLDIGTGSGILSLMVAQRLSKQCDDFQVQGVDIEPEAAAQAGENFEASSWRGSLQAHCADICGWQASQLFDLIISNPPYFGAGQQLECQKRQQARLEDSLSLHALMMRASQLAHSKSRLALIAPAPREGDLLAAAKASGWFLSRCLSIESKAGKAVNRLAMEFSRTNQAPKLDSLTIRLADNHYSAEFKALTKAFYLAF